MMTLKQIHIAQSTGATIPPAIVDNDTLAAHTQDHIILSAAERAEAEADLARMRCNGPITGRMSRKAARAVAVSMRLHLRAIGFFA